MRTLFGYERNNFTVKDGSIICGYNIYMATPITSSDGKGNSAERVYISDAKLDRFGVKLEDLLGKEVNIIYNKYGKIAALQVQPQTK